MSITTQQQFSFNDPKVQQFLVAPDMEFLADFELPSGFKEVKRRDSPFGPEKPAVTFLMKETWNVEQHNVLIGTVSDIVVLGHQIELTICHIILLKTDIDPIKEKRVTELVDAYNSQEHGDFKIWLATQTRDGWISDAEYLIEAVTRLRKIMSDPDEVDISQRKALFNLYQPTSQEQEIPTEIYVLPGDGNTFQRWALNRGTKLQPVSREPVPNAEEPKDTLVSRKVPVGQADASVGGIITDIATRVIPSQCGTLQLKNFKLLSVAAWPEFMVKWEMREFRIGCVTIKTLMPVPYVRISRLVLYAHFNLPANIDQTVILIIETCLKRSALIGGVIGVVIGNLGAAIAAFQAAFTSCMQTEPIQCIHPSLLLLTEAGQWKRI